MKAFHGLNGAIVLGDTCVSILREKFLATTFHNGGETQIAYSDISRVVVIPGSLLNGFICIVEKGYRSPSNVFSALKDENTVIFRFTQNGKAEKMKRLIEARL